MHRFFIRPLRNRLHAEDRTKKFYVALCDIEIIEPYFSATSETNLLLYVGQSGISFRTDRRTRLEDPAIFQKTKG